MKVFVARKLPDAVEEKFKVTFETTFSNSIEPLQKPDLIQSLDGIEGLVCATGDQIGADLINDLPESVKIISTFSVGTDHIDLKACLDKGISVTNTPGALTDATADIGMLLLLTASRRAFEGETLVRENKWTGWHPTQLMGWGLQGKTLGIIGMGRIGQVMAKRARAFDMEIAYYNRSRLSPALEQGATYVEDVDQLCEMSDFISLNCPHTPETEKLIDETRISKMKKGVVIVNTARGPVIDDEALIAALKEGHVAAAGLDVFEGEPNIHPGYRELMNVTLLPHLGSATVETRNAMGFKVIENMQAYSEGRPVPNPVLP